MKFTKYKLRTGGTSFEPYMTRRMMVNRTRGEGGLETFRRLKKSVKKAFGSTKRKPTYSKAGSKKKFRRTSSRIVDRVGPRIKLRPPKDPFAIMNRDGVVWNQEHFNIASDAKSLYLQTVVAQPNVILQVVVKALLRRLFEKAGVTISSVIEVLSLSQFHDSGGPAFAEVVLVQYSAAAGGWTSVPQPLNVGYTLETVASLFYQNFIDWSSGYDNLAGAGNPLNAFTPMTFQLRINNMVQSQVDIMNAEIELVARNIMKIQNSTEAYRPSGTEEENDEEADNVASVSLQGKVYKFGGLPRTKLRNSRNALRDNNIFGVFPVDRLTRQILGATLDLELQEPMGVKTFYNCNEAKNIRINPGEIRTYTLYHKSKWVNLLQFLKKLRLQYENAAGAYVTHYFPFPTLLMGFEEMIQSDSLNNIRVRYEGECKLGVRCRFKQNKYCRTQVFTSSTL